MTLPPLQRLLTGTLVVAALVAIVTAGGDAAWLPAHYVAKPLATFAILLLAATADDPVSLRYRQLIVAGLAWSLLGDVLLMLPGDRFVPGLVAFLLAHLCYIAAFLTESRFIGRPVAYAGYAIVSLTLLSSLFPLVPVTLRLPVLAYVLVVTAMAAQGAVWMLEDGVEQARRAAIGGAWFVVSDASLAIDRFSTDVPYRELVVLGTYFVAQWCIARSVPRDTVIRI